MGLHLSLGFNVLSAVMMAIERTSDRCSWDLFGRLECFISFSYVQIFILHGELLVPAFPRRRWAPEDNLVKVAVATKTKRNQSPLHLAKPNRPKRRTRFWSEFLLEVMTERSICYV